MIYGCGEPHLEAKGRNTIKKCATYLTVLFYDDFKQ